MNKKRLHPDIRRDEILAAALLVAAGNHYAHMTREQIAQQAGVAGPTVQHYFGTMALLRRAVMRWAVRTRCLPVIAQGLVAGDVHARGASEELRREALNSVVGS